MRIRPKDLIAILYNMVSNLKIGESNRMTHHANNFMILMEQYDQAKKYMDIASTSSGESIEKFIRNIKQNVNYYHDLNEDGGLIGSLRYNEVSEDQIKELQKYMRDLNQLSKELFEKYGAELR